MALVDLKMSKKDMDAESQPSASQQSPYPYGLCLRLDGDELDKLGIKDLPAVGDEFHIQAIGCVTSVAEMNSANSESRHIEIQIEQMELSNEGPADGEASVAEEEGEDAEASTVMRSTYRGG